MLKSHSLPETKNEISTFEVENTLLNDTKIEENNSNDKPKDTKSNRGAKRWRLVRMISLMTKRNKHDGERKRAATASGITKSTCDECRDNGNVAPSTKKNESNKIKLTKQRDGVQECCDAGCMADDIHWRDSRRDSCEHYNISNRALAAAVSKWKETIRPSTSPVEYEIGKVVPRRSGVCEEIEKTVQSDGTTLHELRKDLTVYLTLDELGML